RRRAGPPFAGPPTVVTEDDGPRRSGQAGALVDRRPGVPGDLRRLERGGQPLEADKVLMHRAVPVVEDDVVDPVGRQVEPGVVEERDVVDDPEGLALWV